MSGLEGFHCTIIPSAYGVLDANVHPNTTDFSDLINGTGLSTAPAVLPIMSLHVHHGQYGYIHTYDITVDNMLQGSLVPRPSYEKKLRKGLVKRVALPAM